MDLFWRKSCWHLPAHDEWVQRIAVPASHLAAHLCWIAYNNTFARDGQSVKNKLWSQVIDDDIDRRTNTCTCMYIYIYCLYSYLTCLCTGLYICITWIPHLWNTIVGPPTKLLRISLCTSAWSDPMVWNTLPRSFITYLRARPGDVTASASMSSLKVLMTCTCLFRASRKGSTSRLL